jgi:uncharacterized membrane protein
MEREVYAARRTLRARKLGRASASGGYGAVAGSLAGMVAFVTLDLPWLIFVGTILGFVFGGIAGFEWDASEKDNFPPAPPPRGFGS